MTKRVFTGWAGLLAAIILTGTVAGKQARAAGLTPLHMAAATGDTGRVKALLAAGAKVDARDGQKRTPLIVACASMTGQQTVGLLLAAGANANAQDADGQTPLLLAVQSASGDSSLAVVRQLLAAGANPNLCDSQKQTPLHLACQGGGAKIARALIAAGAKVDARDESGQTPLFLAAQAGEADAAAVLIKAGADVNAVDAHRRRPLSAAAENWSWQVFDRLRQAGAKEPSWTPLFLPAITDDDAKVASLIAGGAKVDPRDVQGRTPLIWAAVDAADEAAEQLLKAGANVSAADATGLTALQGAARVGDAKLIGRLIAAKADLACADEDGWTALHWAAWAPDEAATRALLAAGADPNRRAKDGETPLMIAIESKSQPVADALLNAGADILAVRDDGTTAADLARQAGWKGKDFATRLADAQYDRLKKLFARCGAMDPSSARAIRQTSPAQTVRKLIRSTYLGDEAAFLACFTGTPDEMHLAKAGYALGRAELGLAKALIDAYGKTGWREFQDSDAFTLSLLLADESRVKELAPTVEGDKATFPAISGLPGGQIPLVRSDGLWRIEAKYLLRPGARPKDMAQGLERMTAVIQSFRSQVGKPGVTAEGLDQAMSKRMMKDVFGIELKR